MLQTVWTEVQVVLWSWHEWKHYFERSVSFSLDAIHVIVGVLLMLTTALLLRKPVSSWWPWLVVFVVTCINETLDLWVERWPNPGMQYGEGAKDLLLTMLLPTVLLLTARSVPQLYARRSSIAVGRGESPQHGQ